MCVGVCVCQNADIAGVGTSGSAAVDEKEKSSGRVEDQINDEHLRCIEAMFHEADIEGEGGRNTHTHTLQISVSPHQHPC